jgi:hypothetical protein
MKQTWKPIVGGILDLILGVLMFAGLVGESIEYHNLPLLFLLILPVGLLVGGICGLRRRLWWLALAGSICGLVPGLPATMLMASSREEFQRTSKM